MGTVMRNKTKILAAAGVAILVIGATAIADEQAAISGEVNVYSYRQPFLIQPMFDAFTRQSGVKVNVVFAKKGLVERLEQEGRNSPADLIFTVDIGRLSDAKDAGVTQSIRTAALTKAIPEAFRQDEGHWYGLTQRARILYVSKDRVAAADAPKTYEELADPKWAGRICTRSGTHAYNVALTAAYLAHHGPEETKTWLEGVKSNLARKPQGNDRAQVKAIWSGECDIAIGNTYYMGKMLNDEEQKEWAESVRIIFPTFEGGGAHVNISGVAMTKAAPNKENALQLIEFLTSPKAQEIYAEANFEYPIAPGTEPVDLVKSWGSFTPDDLNLMDLAKLRPEALQLIQEVDFDG